MSTRSRRDEIIDTAMALIHRQGYQTTSVEDIIDASKVWRASFYYHFKTKEELGFAVLERQFEQFSALVQQVLDAGECPLEKVDGLLDSVEMFFREHGIKDGCPFGNLVCELSNVHDGFRQRLGRLFHDIEARIAVALSPLTPRLKPGITPEGLAEFIVAGIEGAAVLGKVDQDVAVLERTNAHAKRYLRSCLVD